MCAVCTVPVDVPVFGINMWCLQCACMLYKYVPFEVYRYMIKLCGICRVPVYSINVCCLHSSGVRTCIRYKCVVFAMCLYAV